MTDLETAARRVVDCSGPGGNDLRFFAELGCAIADLRAALQPREVEQIAYPQEHDRAARAIALVRMFIAHGCAEREVCGLLGDARAFLREFDGGKPEEKS